jgi:hypothetical protein
MHATIQAYGATMSSRAVTPEPTPQGSNGGDPAAHQDRGDGWCQACGCYTPCPDSYVRESVPPVSLTRGGFMLGH